VLESLWFVHQGRLGYTGGPLSNLLTNDESHIAIHGGQAVKINDCGGYGMPHGISLFGCGGAIIDKPFFVGGVWNPLLPSAQESMSHVRCADSPIGHNVNIEIVSPQFYGGNTLGVQSRTIGTQNVNARLHCGPLYGLFVESGECVAVRGGFMGGYANSCIVSQAGSLSSILLRIMIDGTQLDESNVSSIRTLRNVGMPMLDGLIITSVDMNGQLVSENGLRFEKSADNSPSVMRVQVTGGTSRAHLASGNLILGADGVRFHGFDAYGYNLANNNVAFYGSGILVDANAFNVDVYHAQFGGGQNGYDETNTIDQSTNLTANGCMYGLAYNGGGTGEHAYIKARNLAKSGGSLISGGVQATP
jgi:hypothetical protein